jgi:hypothetical protein
MGHANQIKGKPAVIAGMTAHALIMKNASGTNAKRTAGTENAMVMKTAGNAGATALAEAIKNASTQVFAGLTAGTENATRMRTAKPAMTAAVKAMKTVSQAHQEQIQGAA